MHCLVTAGPTFEPLDQVRRLTNFSTGQLGSALARFLTARGHQITLLLGEQAIFRSDLPQHLEFFGTTADLEERLRAYAKSSVEAVFHAAAVSDFKFGKIWVRSHSNELTELKAGKISTRQGSLVAELVPTTKIISSLREWFPSARLIGWKYEVDGEHAGVIKAARHQILECRTDACVANGPAYGPGFGLITSKSDPVHLQDQSALFEALANFVQS